MASDAGERLPEAPRAAYAIPNVLDIQTREIQFQSSRLNNFDSSLPGSSAGVEFLVTTDQPIPIRALGPALYVGETPVIEVSPAGPRTYRFVLPEKERIQPGAPIVLSWTGQPPGNERDTPFRYEPPEAAGEQSSPVAGA